MTPSTQKLSKNVQKNLDLLALFPNLSVRCMTDVRGHDEMVVYDIRNEKTGRGANIALKHDKILVDVPGFFKHITLLLEVPPEPPKPAPVYNVTILNGYGLDMQKTDFRVQEGVETAIGGVQGVHSVMVAEVQPQTPVGAEAGKAPVA